MENAHTKDGSQIGRAFEKSGKDRGRLTSYEQLDALRILR